jgi:putative membrane protein
MMHFGNMTGWGMGFWWMGGLLMMALFVWFLYILLGNRTTGNQYHNETARDILSKRFARGEISKEEYNNLLNSL